MRISDWSSDVCSSDLRGLVLHRQRVGKEQEYRAVGDLVQRFRARLQRLHRAREQRAVGVVQRAVDQRLDARRDQAGQPRIIGLAQIMAVQIFQRSEEHTSELQSLMRISYAVFCLKKKK